MSTDHMNCWIADPQRVTAGAWRTRMSEILARLLNAHRSVAVQLYRVTSGEAADAPEDEKLEDGAWYVIRGPGAAAHGAQVTMMSPDVHENDDHGGAWLGYICIVGPMNIHDPVIVAIAGIALAELGGGRLERMDHRWFPEEFAGPDRWMAELERRLAAESERPRDLESLGHWYEHLK